MLSRATNAVVDHSRSGNGFHQWRKFIQNQVVARHHLILYELGGTTPSYSIHQEVSLLFMCAAIVRDCITHKFGKMRSNRVVILGKTYIFAIHVAEITVHLIGTIIELVDVLKMPFN